jgi:hypothetical protein
MATLPVLVRRAGGVVRAVLHAPAALLSVKARKVSQPHHFWVRRRRRARFLPFLYDRLLCSRV